MEPNLIDKKSKKLFNKYGKALLVHALDGFYAFEDDQIEDALENAILKFKGRDDWRKQVRIYLWSFEKIRYKICKTGYDMWGEK